MRDSTLSGKTLLVVNVGSPKKRFILEVMKSLGLRVVALNDRRPAWAEECVADWILAEKGTTVESVIDAVKEHCERHHIRLDGVITFWEEEIPLLARICEAFGLTGNSVQASLNTRSKFAMQELLKKHGEPAIVQHLLRSESDLPEAIRRVGFPAIMKPLYGSDSLSVMYVNSPEEAAEVYRFVLGSFTSPYEGFFAYEKGLVVYQRYIPGKEFSVECACQNGVTTVAGIHEKTPMELPFFIETGDCVPPRISDAERQALEREAVVALAAFGVENSLAHVELKLTPGGVAQIIEVASRMGGDYTHLCTRDVYGFDLVRAGCEIALDIPVSQRSRAPRSCLHARYIIPERSGVVAAVRGAEALSRDPKVVAHSLVSPGDSVRVPPSGFDTAGWIIVRGEHHADAERTMRGILDAITVEIVPA